MSTGTSSESLELSSMRGLKGFTMVAYSPRLWLMVELSSEVSTAKVTHTVTLNETSTRSHAPKTPKGCSVRNIHFCVSTRSTESLRTAPL
eukprot:1146496-Pelagomonas_calceolata.AAC.3